MEFLLFYGHVFLSQDFIFFFQLVGYIHAVFICFYRHVFYLKIWYFSPNSFDLCTCRFLYVTTDTCFISRFDIFLQARVMYVHAVFYMFLPTRVLSQDLIFFYQLVWSKCSFLYCSTETCVLSRYFSIHTFKYFSFSFGVF